MNSLTFLGAHELARLIRDREISSLELADHYIRRIEQLDGDINAVVVRDFERALEAATRADRQLSNGELQGPLHGVPVTVKETLDVAGLSTSWGVPQLKENIADRDAEAVNRLKQAGAILLGKTNVPMALADIQTYNEVYGTTNNPWDKTCTPGGSSGGSAAALAAGFCALELGSDMGGSIRAPAHFCGLFAHKPSWGIVPDQGHGLPGMVAPTDIGVIGPLARSAHDLGLAMDILTGVQPLDQPAWQLDLRRPVKQSLKEYKVALWPQSDLAPVDSEITEQIQSTGELLASAGAQLSYEARPNIDFASNLEIYQNLMWSLNTVMSTDQQFEEARELAASLPIHDKSSTAMAARAGVLSHRDWLVFNNQREHIRYAWKNFFEEWDILICPAFATPAFAHDHGALPSRRLEVNGVAEDYFLSMFWAGISSVSYLPSTVFPTGLSSKSLPIGLQAVGAAYSDYITIDFVDLLTQQMAGFQIPPAYCT